MKDLAEKMRTLKQNHITDDEFVYCGECEIPTTDVDGKTEEKGKIAFPQLSLMKLRTEKTHSNSRSQLFKNV